MFNANTGTAALSAFALLISVEASALPESVLPIQVQDEVLVVPKATVNAQAVRSLGMQVAAEHQGATRFLRLKLAKGQTVEQAVSSLSTQPWVAHAQPNYIYHASALPNDTRFSEYWGLRNTGQTVNGTAGSSGADISAVGAWDDTTDCSAITVSVVDTGVTYNHPDLSPNMWSNTLETAGNGIDDDGNGFIDDVRGWDFVQGDNDPLDLHYHGTHVAGTIGAVGNNALGGTGVCWNVKIMPLRVLDANGSGYTSDIAAAVDYAVANGAKVINMSLGGTGGSAGDILDTAIANADAAGVLVVAAAGNSSVDNDITPHYPAAYTQPNIISVAATDQNDALASFSNFGATSVDIAAPGVNTLSTAPPARQTVASWNFDDGTVQSWTPETFDTTSGIAVATTNTVAVTTTKSYSPSYSLTDSPAGLYANDRSYRATSPTVDLTGLQNAMLNFQMDLNTEYGYDPVLVEVWNGATWTTVTGWYGSTAGVFYPFSADIGTLDGQASAKVRFRLETDSSVVYDGFFIDDVAVTIPGTSFNGSEYQYLNGTSMATPHVAGLAALVWAADTGQTHLQVRDKILNNGDTVPALTNITVTGRRINAQLSMPLRPVTGLNASATATRVDLGWTDNSVSEITYQVERQIGTGSYTTLTTLGANASAYFDTTVPAASNLSYRITGYSRDGLSLAATPLNVTTPPLAPTGLAASAGTGSVSVSWAAASGATSYNLYWGTSAGVTPATGTKVTGVTSPYTHSGLPAGTYYYVVTALKDSAESSAASEASATVTASTTSSGGGGGGGSTDLMLLVTLFAGGFYLRRRRKA